MQRVLLLIGIIIVIFIWTAPDGDAPEPLDIRNISLDSSLDMPVQHPIPPGQQYQINDYALHPQADIEFTARLLGKESYRLGREADLSPVDLALGWGPMADPDVLSKLRISQSGRWMHWSADSLPIPRKDIEHNAANVHVIPMNKEIEDEIDRLREGDVIKIQGKLVNVKAKDGFYWNSSLTRTDTGDGACEVMLLTKVEVTYDPY